MAHYIEEKLDNGLRYSYKVNQIICSRQTKFQKLDLVETQPFGHALLIDGLMQSSDLDEFIYHECLVHPAMLAHPNPKTVFIAGGGEGSTLREILKHSTVEHCTMCDIDEEVVDFCRNTLSQNKDAFNDKRTKLVHDDALKYLEDNETKYDVIIVDVDDPTEEGPCVALFTKEYYELVKSRLNPGGVMATQCSATGVQHHKLVFTAVSKTLAEVFSTVKPYTSFICSFGDNWGWAIGSDAPVPPAETLDQRIAERGLQLRYLDGTSIHGQMQLSKMLKDAIKAETRVISKANPVHFFSVNSFTD